MIPFRQTQQSGSPNSECGRSVPMMPPPSSIRLGCPASPRSRPDSQVRLPGPLYTDFHIVPQAFGEIDELLQGELVQSAAGQIRDARLGNSQRSAGLDLAQAAIRQDAVDPARNL